MELDRTTPTAKQQRRKAHLPLTASTGSAGHARKRTNHFWRGVADVRCSDVGIVKYIDRQSTAIDRENVKAWNAAGNTSAIVLESCSAIVVHSEPDRKLNHAHWSEDFMNRCQAPAEAKQLSGLR